MPEATQMGAEDVSVEDRIAAALAPEEPAQETTVETTDTDVDVVDEINDEEALDADSEGPDDESGEVTDETDAIDEIELEADQLAEYLGVDASAIDVDDDGQLVLNTKVNGESGTATLKDLIKNYQLESSVNQKSMDLAEERKSFDAQTQQAKQQLQQSLQQSTALLDVQKQNLMGEYQSIDWQQLEQQDPGLYAATRQNMAERHAQIEQATQFVDSQNTQVNQEQRAQYLQKEAQALDAVLPQWADPEVKAKEQAEVSKYLNANGYKPEEIAQVADHRAVMIARKAMLYDAMQTQQETKAEITKKKLVKKPKVLKPGAVTSKQSKAQAAQKAKLKLVKQSGGSVDAVAKLLLDRM
ncbi:MAG: hypothetical protein GY938_20505 [Ketobacter sp.]|nr:hypothetical protein [Ketobacter sp.]